MILNVARYLTMKI